MKTYIISAVISLAVIVSFLLFIPRKEIPVRIGSAGNIEATMATSSVYQVSTTAATVFATSTCSSRVISTVAKPIMIVFGGQQGQTPTGIFGHLQSASTTVNYDAGVYGCNAWKIYGFDAASTITVSEFR